VEKELRVRLLKPTTNHSHTHRNTLHKPISSISRCSQPGVEERRGERREERGGFEITFKWE